MAKTWSQCKSRTLVCLNTGLILAQVDQYTDHAVEKSFLAAQLFFPRVRTPCGHVPKSSLKEGKCRCGENDKENPTTKQLPTTAHRPSLHHPAVFPLCAEVKQVKRKLLTVGGPEFSNEEHGSAGLCFGKVSRKSSNGLHISITGDQQPVHGVAKTWF